LAPPDGALSENEVVGVELGDGDAVEDDPVRRVNGDRGVAAGLRCRRRDRGEVGEDALDVDAVADACACGEVGDRVDAKAGGVVKEDVVAARADQRVVAGAAGDLVVAGPAVDDIVAGRSVQHHSRADVRADQRVVGAVACAGRRRSVDEQRLEVIEERVIEGRVDRVRALVGDLDGNIGVLLQEIRIVPQAANA